MSTPLPHLPNELLDRILLKAASTLDPPSVSSIALSSRTLRNYANIARFTSIKLCNEERQISKADVYCLNSLADLIKSGKRHARIPGMETFIQTFTIRTSGYIDELQPFLHGGALGYIFRNLFRRTTELELGENDACALDIEIQEWPRDTASHHRIKGAEMDYRVWCLGRSRLGRSFTYLLRNSDLGRLHLGHIQNIPSNFLQGSRVRHLSLHDISFKFLKRTSEDQPIVLLSVFLDDLPISCLRRIEYLTHTRTFHYSYGVAVLTKATFGIRNDHDFDLMNAVLYHTTNVRTLKIMLHLSQTEHRNTAFQIEYAHLLHLESMTFSCSRWSFALVEGMMEYDIPSSLNRVEVWLSEKFQSVLFEDAEDYLELYPFATLDRHFSRPSFHQLRTIMFAFEIEISSDYSPHESEVYNFKERYHTYVTSRFLMCKEMGDIDKISVPVHIRIVGKLSDRVLEF